MSQNSKIELSDDTYILKKVYNALNCCDRIRRTSAQFGPDYNAICIVMEDGTKKILILKKYEGEKDGVYV